MDRRAFWQGKRVLVTGHTGFKGAWLALWLQALEADVVGLALPPTAPHGLFEVAGVARDMASLLGDISDSTLVHDAVADHRPEVVFHLAAQPLVRASYDDPVATYRTNVVGTATVLEAARAAGSVRAAVVVTSDKCYENREWPWPYREVDALGGHDPYSSSKACAEIVTTAFRRSYFSGGGTRLASARAGNVIGGGDWATDRVVPDLIRGATAEEEVVLRNPAAVRPWQHVLDCLAGYLALAERLWEDDDAADAWNFGPPAEDFATVATIVEGISARWPGGIRTRVDAGGGPHEARLLVLDATKARQTLGWRPLLDLDQALDLTAEWYLAHHRDDDMRKVTLAQLETYGALS